MGGDTSHDSCFREWDLADVCTVTIIIISFSAGWEGWWWEVLSNEDPLNSEPPKNSRNTLPDNLTNEPTIEQINLPARRQPLTLDHLDLLHKHI